MKQIKRADLHMHSTFSDGVEEPEELVVRAKNNGVELISLTDHDETGGLERMRAAAAQHGLQFVNGVEISADYGEVSIHVVGLDFDPEDEMLQALLSRIRDNRFPFVLGYMKEHPESCQEIDIKEFTNAI